ncbi:chaplin [Streptacidiphilus cavernicola]|uniref:Chaplin n=1 Tax=Streptacidiphilus cavernicola TaxID=3342716 RepID=A0ABV6VW44_9ACTN
MINRSVRTAAVLTGAAGALVLAAAGTSSADSNAYGAAFGSPGVLSGNVIQIPIDVPINVCGNSVNVIGALNPAFGNHCSNGGGDYGHGDMGGWHATGWQHTWHHGGDDNNCDSQD